MEMPLHLHWTPDWKEVYRAEGDPGLNIPAHQTHRVSALRDITQSLSVSEKEQ